MKPKTKKTIAKKTVMKKKPAKAKRQNLARGGRVKATSATALVDLTPEEIKKLPKPREGFEAFVAGLVALYNAEEEVQFKGFDTSALEAAFSTYQALQPLEASAAKQLEMVQETRLLNSSTTWSGMLAIYKRAQSVAGSNKNVARGIADFTKFMKLGPRKPKAAK